MCLQIIRMMTDLWIMVRSAMVLNALPAILPPEGIPLGAVNSTWLNRLSAGK